MHHKKYRWIFCGFLVLLALLIPSGVWAYPEEPADREVLGKGYNHGPIWKIESETNTVYLLGSIHVLRPDYYPLTRAFWYAYYDSHNIVFEVDGKVLYSGTPPKKLQQKARFPQGKTLKTVLSRKTYKLLKSRLKTIGIDIKHFHRYKPWVLAQVVRDLRMLKKGYSGIYGVDYHFYQKARLAGKHISGLETIDDQLKLFSKYSLKNQEKMLLQVLKEPKQMNREFTRLVNYWHKGNVEGLGEILEELQAQPLAYKALIYDRNMNWLPQIEAFLTKDENYLVIVGAGHLVGEDGLVELLRQKGHEVEKMTYALP